MASGGTSFSASLPVLHQTIILLKLLDTINIVYFNGCSCVEQINKTNRGEISEEELKERQVST